MQKINFSTLIKEELVKRFESVVTNEINMYRNAQLDLLNKFSSLENELSLLRKELSFLKDINDKSYNDVVTKFITEKNNLKEEFDEQRRFIRENISTVDRLVNSVTKKVSNFVDNIKFDEFMDETNYAISQTNVEINDCNEKIYSFISETEKELRKDLFSNLDNQQFVVNKLTKAIDEFRLNLNECFTSNEAFIKELQAHKRTVFVQEKKIENLYTLIERLEKRITK